MGMELSGTCTANLGKDVQNRPAISEYPISITLWCGLVAPHQTGRETNREELTKPGILGDWPV